MTLRILCYFQEGCMGCMEQEPINREVERTFGVTVEERDAMKHPEDIRRYALTVTPTVLVLVDGEVKERFEGVAHTETLGAAIEKYR
ncbi:thioredoxin family protein [uncultured Methanofollis sp.]|uniref:thioredoxin family protein n=1 Tax=uncultured Methanofollis sp. TaxID=262500 RepID=UPI00260DD0FF|nr:thioredoxin family protein [uncultured Methanofollis sp.]